MCWSENRVAATIALATVGGSLATEEVHNGASSVRRPYSWVFLRGSCGGGIQRCSGISCGGEGEVYATDDQPLRDVSDER